MDTNDPNEVLARRVSRAMALVLMAGAVAVPYVVERRYRRWVKERDPYEDVRAFMLRSRTGFRNKKQGASEFASVIGEIMVEVERAMREN